MKAIGRLCAALLIFGLGGFVGAQEGQAPDADAMASMMAAMSPGEHHAEMKGLVGDWKATVKVWQAPGAEPMVSEATSSNELALGGRYLKQVLHGNMMGMDFEGLGISGYDNTTHKHTMMWIDNMGTSMMVSADGTCSEGGKVTTQTTTQKNPMGGPDMNIKMVTRIVSKDQHVFEYFVVGEDGSEFKAMEIVYDRI